MKGTEIITDRLLPHQYFTHNRFFTVWLTQLIL